MILDSMDVKRNLRRKCKVKTLIAEDSIISCSCSCSCSYLLVTAYPCTIRIIPKQCQYKKFHS